MIPNGPATYPKKQTSMPTLRKGAVSRGDFWNSSKSLYGSIANQRTSHSSLFLGGPFSFSVRFEGWARTLPAGRWGRFSRCLLRGCIWCCAHWFWEARTEAPLSQRKGTRCQLLNLLYKIYPWSDALDWNFGNKWLALVVVTETEVVFSTSCYFFELAPPGGVLGLVKGNT